jgi:hypothetical protein
MKPTFAEELEAARAEVYQPENKVDPFHDGVIEGAEWGARFALQSAVVREMAEALRMQHQWQQEIGVVKLMPGDHELNLSLEYSDSTMCEKTHAALAAYEQATKGGG